MTLKFINPASHAILDYIAATALLVLPFVLDLAATSALALWLSVGGGITLIGYSLATDYGFLGARPISFRAHSALDLGAAALFMAAPAVFGWSGLTAIYYYVMGAGVLVVVAFSATRAPARPGILGQAPR